MTNALQKMQSLTKEIRERGLLKTQQKHEYQSEMGMSESKMGATLNAAAASLIGKEVSE